VRAALWFVHAFDRGLPDQLAFPGRHDDQVDALTQGLAWGRVRRGEFGVSYYAMY